MDRLSPVHELDRNLHVLHVIVTLLDKRVLRADRTLSEFVSRLVLENVQLARRARALLEATLPPPPPPALPPAPP